MVAKYKQLLEERSQGESSTLRKLRLKLAESENRAVEVEKKLSKKCRRISALKQALKQTREGENHKEP